jgi:hypothetical protein
VIVLVADTSEWVQVILLVLPFFFNFFFYIGALLLQYSLGAGKGFWDRKNDLADRFGAYTIIFEHEGD